MNSPVCSLTYLTGMNFWWKTICFVMFGVSTPQILPMSFKITSPNGTSSQKKRACKFKTTFDGSAGSFGTIGNGTLEYPRLVLKILFRDDLSVTWPSYMMQTRSANGMTWGKLRFSNLVTRTFLIF